MIFPFFIRGKNRIKGYDATEISVVLPVGTFQIDSYLIDSFIQPGHDPFFAENQHIFYGQADCRGEGVTKAFVKNLDFMHIEHDSLVLQKDLI